MCEGWWARICDLGKVEVATWWSRIEEFWNVAMWIVVDQKDSCCGGGWLGCPVFCLLVCHLRDLIVFIGCQHGMADWG